MREKFLQFLMERDFVELEFTDVKNDLHVTQNIGTDMLDFWGRKNKTFVEEEC